MENLIKIFIAFAIVSLCEGCHVFFSNRMKQEHPKIRLASSTVIINRNPFVLEPLEHNYIDQGSIIHRQAVLALNSKALHKPYLRVKCIGGCGDLQPAALINTRNCQVRDSARIINGPLDANDTRSYAIIILKSPFDLNGKTSVINMARDPMVYSNCYFYAVTVFTIINEYNLREKNVALVSPYQAKIVNNSVEASKCDGVNYTNIIEDTYLRIEKSEIAFKKHYRGSPLICRRNNTDFYEQIGFFNMYLDDKKPYEHRKSETFIDTTFAYDSIYKILNEYLNPTPIHNNNKSISNSTASSSSFSSSNSKANSTSQSKSSSSSSAKARP